MVNTQIMNSVNTWGLDVFSAATLIKVHFGDRQFGNALFCGFPDFYRYKQNLHKTNLGPESPHIHSL